MKRTFDIIFSTIVLLLFTPFALLIIPILKLTGEGYAFYLQPRVGQHGKLFKIIKFATMFKDSPNMSTGVITLKNDFRVLPFGKFLRKTKINELPQFLNVLLGHMSIVGPRPQTPPCFSLYNENAQKTLVTVKPGLTSLAAIIFRDEEHLIGSDIATYQQRYNDTIVPYKGELEIWYVKHRSFLLDLKIVFLTAIAICFPKTQVYQRFLSHDIPLRSFCYSSAQKSSH